MNIPLSLTIVHDDDAPDDISVLSFDGHREENDDASPRRTARVSSHPALERIPRVGSSSSRWHSSDDATSRSSPNQPVRQAREIFRNQPHRRNHRWNADREQPQVRLPTRNLPRASNNISLKDLRRSASFASRNNKDFEQGSKCLASVAA